VIIYILLYFNKEDIDDVVNSLNDLSSPIKPLYYGEDENRYSPNDRLEDLGRFNDFKKDNGCGYFLFSKSCCYNVSMNRFGHAEIFVDLDITKSGLNIAHAQEVIDCVRKHGLIFGFAADRNEYFHRNQLSFFVSVGYLTTWVGRDLRKYLPGFYWLTAISENIAIQHGLDLARLPKYIQVFSAEGKTRCKMFRFYESPWQWKKYKRQIDDLCEEMKGVFSIREVKDYKRYRKLPELNQYLSQYR
jgi:hypothetical protein